MCEMAPGTWHCTDCTGHITSFNVTAWSCDLLNIKHIYRYCVTCCIYHNQEKIQHLAWDYILFRCECTFRKGSFMDMQLIDVLIILIINMRWHCWLNKLFQLPSQVPSLSKQPSAQFPPQSVEVPPVHVLQLLSHAEIWVISINLVSCRAFIVKRVCRYFHTFWSCET